MKPLIFLLFARFALAAEDRRLISAFFGEYNYESQKVDQNPYLNLDCAYDATSFEECDKVFLVGGNFIEEGIFDKIDKCENRPMYKHVDVDLYIYSQEPVGWIVTKEPCGEDPGVLAIGLEDDVAARAIRVICSKKTKEAKRFGGTFASALTMIEPIFKDLSLCEDAQNNYRKLWQDVWETVGETKRVEVDATE